MHTLSMERLPLPLTQRHVYTAQKKKRKAGGTENGTALALALLALVQPSVKSAKQSEMFLEDLIILSVCGCDAEHRDTSWLWESFSG